MKQRKRGDREGEGETEEGYREIQRDRETWKRERNREGSERLMFF